MTFIWLVCYVMKHMPQITQWWPPSGWSLTLYICLIYDAMESFKPSAEDRSSE